MSTARPNKYQGTCSKCGQTVPAQAGRLGPKVDGRWTTEHNPGECPTTGCGPATPKRAQVDFTPTPEQAEAVAKFNTGGNLVIQAGAGAGKTSTLRLLAAAADAQGRRGWYGAYNKAIVADVAGTMPGNVECSTMHSLAFRAVGRTYAHRLSTARQRLDEQARILGIDPYTIQVGTEARTLAAGWLARKALRAVTRFCQTADTEIGARHFEHIDGIDLPDENGNRTYVNNEAVKGYLLPFARMAWEDLTDPTGRLRFSHDIYLKLWQLSDPVINADFILFDEAQDADPVQAAIIEAQAARGTQIVCVGDEMQVLYEWRGAVNAMADFERSGAQVTYLSQSFRFGDAVAEVANGLLGRLDARLRIRGFGAKASTVGPVADPDAVLCRTNAGAVRTVLTALTAGRRPHLVGSADQIIWFCKGAQALQAGRGTDHPELAIFDSWVAVQEYVSSEADDADDLKLMVKLIDEFSAETIIAALERQPREDLADLVVSTAHKSKGREWNRVQIAGDFFPPKDGASDLPPAELRLAYVACTRAKVELDLSRVPHFAPDWTPGQQPQPTAGL